ncbi:uncharacterized protein LOC130944497 [Arachis stenosperma]|uniref:uncharacterized protein LOC130944497 n=1 Tax=Arachis stenosperma TaxID=217475 RepID=UPI0025AC76DA|nr:uncharacterized protein LOC130944497 [Arachis stenosperma]XP_057728823.1 uncharacterized protein LOC130944497 [Arachis stenosperma]
MMLSRRVAAALPFRFAAPVANQVPIPKHHLPLISFHPQNVAVLCSRSNSSLSQQSETEHVDYSEFRTQQSNLKPGLYLVGTPIGNLEDITFRALRVLNSANVILSEDTRHSGKLLHHYNIKTPLMSYHKFNESQREQLVLKRLKEGEIVALISDAGTPGISDPGMELAKLCVSENILVVPIPGPCALVSALSASGLPTHEFTFVGFLPKHSGSRRKRLMSLADQTATQIFYVPPHKLSQFLEEASSIFGDARQCVIAREMTKLHEEFWRGTVREAKEVFLMRQPKGELTILIEGQTSSKVEPPSDSELEDELRELIASGETLSTAVKLIAGRTSASKKTIYSLALKKFGKQLQVEDDSN